MTETLFKYKFFLSYLSLTSIIWIVIYTNPLGGGGVDFRPFLAFSEAIEGIGIFMYLIPNFWYFEILWLPRRGARRGDMFIYLTAKIQLVSWNSSLNIHSYEL